MKNNVAACRHERCWYSLTLDAMFVPYCGQVQKTTTNETTHLADVRVVRFCEKKADFCLYPRSEETMSFSGLRIEMGLDKPEQFVHAP